MMGLYDTFYLDGKCKKCGAIMSEWQTKQLGCLLDIYREGDGIKTTGIQLIQGNISVYNYCPECDTLNNARVYVVNGRVGMLKMELDE